MEPTPSESSANIVVRQSQISTQSPRRRARFVRKAESGIQNFDFEPIPIYLYEVRVRESGTMTSKQHDLKKSGSLRIFCSMSLNIKKLDTRYQMQITSIYSCSAKDIRHKPLTGSWIEFLRFV